MGAEPERGPRGHGADPSYLGSRLCRQGSRACRAVPQPASDRARGRGSRTPKGGKPGERVEVIAQVTVAHGRGGWCARGGAQARLLPASSGDRGTAALSLGLQVGSQVPAAAARQSVSLTPLPCSTPGAKEAKVPQPLSREGQA